MDLTHKANAGGKITAWAEEVHEQKPGRNKKKQHKNGRKGKRDKGGKKEKNGKNRTKGPKPK